MLIDRPSTAPALRSPDWYRSATRWTQLTFVEDDPLHFDRELWTRLMAETGSNALCISAGGYIAYYPTDIAHHYRSRHLGTSDLFGDMVESARSLDMHVMARVDPHAIHADAAAAHPEWVARDSEGQPVEHWSFPGIYLTDPFSSYHREFITEVAREITRGYDVDALFANRWEGQRGVTYSEGTARRFFDDTGHQLPRTDRPDDPAWLAYTRWRSQRLSELVVLWDDAVREIRSHVRFMPNRGALLTRDLVREMVDDRYPMFVIDKQGRYELEPIWTAGRMGKRSRGMFPDRPVNLLTSVGPEHHGYRWKDSVSPGAEIVTWMVDGFIHGAQPWFTKFNAVVSDDRWVAPVSEAFDLHRRLEPLLSAMSLTHEVAILDNIRPDPRNPWGAYTADSSDEDGFYQALVEARIPFDYVADTEITLERLTPYRVIVLPNCRTLGEHQVEVLRQYLAAGGSLVAAHESTLLEEDGSPRGEFGLAEELGVRLTSPARGPLKNNYVAITAEHPVSSGFDGARRIIGGTWVVGVEASAGTEVPFRFVPDYPDLPMEELYPREGPRDPAVVTRETGAGGRTVYLAFNLGQIFWDALQGDHGQLIANAVCWARGGAPRVEVGGQGLVDVAVWEDADSLAVAVVNLSNPMAMRGQLRQVVPLSGQSISIRLPEGVGVRAEAVLAGEALDVVEVGGRAQVELPSVHVVELVHFRFTRV